jgi:hypothetical protein
VLVLVLLACASCSSDPAGESTQQPAVAPQVPALAGLSYVIESGHLFLATMADRSMVEFETEDD